MTRGVKLVFSHRMKGLALVTNISHALDEMGDKNLRYLVFLSIIVLFVLYN